MKKYLFALLALTIAMSGCAVYTPAGSVVVDPAGHGGHHRGDGDGKFCPPGQAKKGNC